MKLFIFFIYKIFLIFKRLIKFGLSSYYKNEFSKCGHNVKIDGFSVYAGLHNFYFGNNISIPHGATFYSTEAKLVIGNNVMFGPNPTIITGDHRIDVVGKVMIDVHEKLPENDKDVIIEDDVWVGANVTILKGVIIGRGSVVAAGSVVTKSCPPYSVIGGVPAKVIKYRFSPEQIEAHEKLLYSEDNRLSIDEIIKQRHIY